MSALLVFSFHARAGGVVSLNLCTDQMLVLLAPARVAALERLARDPALSFVAAEARRLPVVQADVEAVLELHPDLVLAGRYGAQTTVALLRARGLRVVQVDEPQDFAAIAAQTSQLADLLGVGERGRALVRAMWAHLAAVAKPVGRRSAILWQARGWTAGPGSLGDAVLRAAGFSNLGTGGAVGVEAMLTHPPDLLVTESAPDFPSLATDMVRHPALRAQRRAEVAPALLLCGGAVQRGGCRGAGALRVFWGLVLGLAVASLLVGAAGFGVPDALILWQIRVPRTALAMLVGGGLGLSGAVLQGALRNPLADPGFLGVGGCAAVGAVVVFYWGIAAWFPPALPLGGLAGAGVGCGLLLGFAGRAASGPSLILAGVALSALAASALALALTVAPNPFALAEITFWLMGGLEDRTLAHLALAGPLIVLGCWVLLRLGRRLDALSLGEATAASLGVPVGGTLRLAALGVALAVGAGAAVSGGIGFVGLVVPHLLRPVFGERPGSLLLPSLLGGAALLLAADLLTRLGPLVLGLAQEPRLGVLTALLGAPFLVAIARRVAP